MSHNLHSATHRIIKASDCDCVAPLSHGLTTKAARRMGTVGRPDGVVLSPNC